MDNSLTFLKLGGSLITVKSEPRVLRPDVLAAVCEEIAAFRTRRPDETLVLGHGSGSFGHVPAEKYQTRAGVYSDEGWGGFSEVWFQASQLNSIIRDQLVALGVPVISFPLSAAAIATAGKIEHWNLKPISNALNKGLVPMVYGDVVFDEVLGGTILSTEDIFVHLAKSFQPDRILLAGLEDGVWADFANRTGLLKHITPDELDQLWPQLGTAEGIDTTGGMAEKVRQMAALVKEMPQVEVVIFSGLNRSDFRAALDGQPVGTLISYPDT